MSTNFVVAQMLKYLIIALISLPSSLAIAAEDSSQTLTASAYRHDLSLTAINYGGAEYTDPKGVRFVQDPNGTGAGKSVDGVIDGTQRGEVFETYREGPLEFQHKLPNGDYSLTMLFVEPDGLAVGERVFDVFVQGEKAIPDLDIKKARWGTTAIALERTVPNVSVTDGELRIKLERQRGEPVISGLIVRRKQSKDDNWALLWNDEFDGSGPPDSGKWTHEIWEPGRVNSERQAYTQRLENARVEGGKLIIEAHKEDYKDAAYTSSRIHTRGAMDIRYGRIDIRARLAGGQGTWGALWMLPSDAHKYASDCESREDWQGAGAACNAWPNSGEIDIVEYVGYDEGVVHGSVHTASAHGGSGVTASVAMPDVEDTFHVYSLEWDEGEIVMRIDGVPFFHYSDLGSGWEAWPFDHPFHLVFNLAIGGSWGEAGGPVDDSIFPARMEIDYVRVFKPASPVKDPG